MYYYKQKNDEGDYTDGEARFTVLTAERVICPPGQTPEENGWHRFASLEECLDAWGLTYDPASPLQGYAEAGPPLPRQNAEAGMLSEPISREAEG